MISSTTLVYEGEKPSLVTFMHMLTVLLRVKMCFIHMCMLICVYNMPVSLTLNICVQNSIKNYLKFDVDIHIS